MKFLIKLFIFLSMTISVLQAQAFKEPISSNLENVSIFQEGEEIPLNNETFKIEKDGFQILFYFKKPINFLVNASETSESFDRLFSETLIHNVPGFSGTGMAEGLRNDTFDITLSSESPNAWFYSDEEKNRFDINEIRNHRFISTRTIENIRYQGLESIPVSFTEIEELYVCIVEYEYKDYKRAVLSKTRFKIEFE